MGASFTVPRSKSSKSTIQEKAPTIVECRNKAQWTARFEATKETNKLVSFHMNFLSPTYGNACFGSVELIVLGDLLCCWFGIDGD